jgi:hypothetical protein
VRGEIAGEVLDGVDEAAIVTTLETLAAVRERIRERNKNPDTGGGCRRQRRLRSGATHR